MNLMIKTQMVEIGKLLVGDFIVNLGAILEIEEKDNHFVFVIGRMNERQVWRFPKTESILLRLGDL